MSEAIKDWLRTKRVQLWGPGYDLTDEKELDLAAAWFQAELSEYEAHFLSHSAKAIEMLIETQWAAQDGAMRADAAAPWYPPAPQWAPPAKGTHESEFNGIWGPLLDDGHGGWLPGTDTDQYYDRAYDWSRS